MNTLPPAPPKNSLTYASYLKVPELLSLQSPLSDPPQHDEVLFILIHQVYELWFKQLLHELEALRTCFEKDQVLKTHKIFKRVIAIQRVLVQQIEVLETMTPEEFNSFRERLNPASGFQSAQFREVEYLSGLKDERYLAFHEHTPEVHKKLKKRLEEASIYDSFVACLNRKGFSVGTQKPKSGSPESKALIDVLKTIYQNPESQFELYLTCEHLIQYDEFFQLWRFCHVKMVERTIGTKRGTGGSSGAAYLRKTVDLSFFPELWDVRSELGNLY